MILAAVLVTAVAGILIGLPTLRLRGDYIAIVTLAFGEIVRVVAINGTDIKIVGMPLTAGKIGISGVDAPVLPGHRDVRRAPPADRGTGRSSRSC